MMTLMKKVTQADAALIAKAMNMKVDIVAEIIVGMYYYRFSELVMAVLVCMKPLPLYNEHGERERE